MPVKRGSILAETVLVMPLLLLLVFGIIQFALIWTAKQMTAYAAFCATRAIMVVPPSEQQGAANDAAKVALSWMCMVDSGQTPVSIPGWGGITGSGSSNDRVRAQVLPGCNGVAAPVAAVEVKFKYPLLIPGMAVNRIVATGATSTGLVGEGEGLLNFYEDLHEAAGTPGMIAGWPYIELKEACVLPMPYSTENFPAGGFAGTNIHGGGS